MWCGIYISCTTASGADEMKEKQHNREKQLEGKREEGGVLPGAGKWRRSRGECVIKKKAEEVRESKRGNLITWNTRG